MVTLVVGPKSVKFSVSEATLLEVPFFNRALTLGFRESFEKETRMPEDDPDLVGLVLAFLHEDEKHLGTILPRIKPKIEDVSTPRGTDRLQSYFIDAWIFADKLQFALLQDALLHYMSDFSVPFGIEKVKSVYDRTCPGLKLRKFVCAHEWTNNATLDIGQIEHYGATLEILVNLMETALRRVRDQVECYDDSLPDGEKRLHETVFMGMDVDPEFHFDEIED